MGASTDRIDPELADYIRQAGQIVAALAPGVSLRVVSGYRSPQKQAELLAAFRRGDRRGIRAEPASASLHTLGRAVDLQFAWRGALVPVDDTPAEYWELLGELLEPVGVRWGGRFRQPDVNHFDL